MIRAPSARRDTGGIQRHHMAVAQPFIAVILKQQGDKRQRLVFRRNRGVRINLFKPLNCRRRVIEPLALRVSTAGIFLMPV